MENNFPEKFKNEDGTLNTESLIRSYTELEKKIGGMVNVPTDDSDTESRDKFNHAIGVPDTANDYPTCPMFLDVPEIKEKFREIGLTKTQAESVYKMAQDILAPAIQDIFSSHNETENMTALKQMFGDDNKMVSTLKEIDAYAQKKLSPVAYDELASSADGIKTIYNMMKSDEPSIKTTSATNVDVTENDLRQMMRDPKYWRDHDDEFIRKIETGFKKLYH